MQKADFLPRTTGLIENKSHGKDTNISEKNKGNDENIRSQTLQNNPPQESDRSQTVREPAIDTQLNWKHETDVISNLPEGEGLPSQPDGSMTFVERILSEQKGITFMGEKLTGKAEIKSTQDIAFLFKNLESAASENVFCVLHQADGKYCVLYLSTGTASKSFVDIKQIEAAVRETGAVSVSLVHNHPSGSLVASREDYILHSAMYQTVSVKVNPSVIINLNSGKYAVFDLSGSDETEKKTQEGKFQEAGVYQFDRLKLYENGQERYTITTPQQIAGFLSRHKRGTVDKIQLLVLDSKNRITRYVLLDANLSGKDLISSIVGEAGKHGEKVVLVSNAMFHPDMTLQLQETLAMAGVTLLDELTVKQDKGIINSYVSAREEGLLGDTQGRYGQVHDSAGTPGGNTPKINPGESILDYAARVSEWNREQANTKNASPGRTNERSPGKKPEPYPGEPILEYVNRLSAWNREQQANAAKQTVVERSRNNEQEREREKKKLDGRALVRPVRDAIIDRRMELNKANYETNLFVHRLEQSLTKAEREAIPFIIEVNGMPESLRKLRPDLAAIVDAPGERVKKAVEEIRGRFDAMWENIRNNTDDYGVGYLSDYITHMWDFKKSPPEAVRMFSVTRNRYLNERTIPSLRTGMESGLVPKTMDVADIIRRYETHAHEVIENSKLINLLKWMGKDGDPFLIEKEQAPSRFVEINNDALAKYRVNPDIRQAIQAVFGQNRMGDSDSNLEKVWRAYEAISGLMKKTLLSLSLFHHGALTETSIASSGLAGTGKAVWNMFSSTPPAFKNPELSRDAVAHGVQLGASSDIPVDEIRNATAKIRKFMEDRKIPVVKELAQALDWANAKWDKALWEYLHDGFKVYGYERLAAGVRERAIGNGIDGATLEKQLREVSQLINDVYGGQHWDVLGVTPMQERILRAFLLSPDWTISSIRQALAPTGIGSLYNDDVFWQRMFKNDPVMNVRKRLGVMFWLRAALYFGIGMNVLNWIFRKQDEDDEKERAVAEDRKSRYDGEGALKLWKDYTMAGNAPGHQTHLFTGRYDDGTERYLRWGKQFRELPELLLDDSGFSFPKPMLKKVGGKANPLLNLGSQAFTGKSLGGFENRELSGAKGWGYSQALLGAILKSFLPFSVSGGMRNDKEFTPSDLIMPSSKGMSPSKTIELYVKGLENEDYDYIRDVYVGAQRNGLNAYDLFKSALQISKSRTTRGILKGITTVEKAEKAIKDAEARGDSAAVNRLYNRLDQLLDTADEENDTSFEDVLEKLEDEGLLNK
jgi:DNA repair protein RadC